MHKVFDGIDWMLQHHPFISVTLLLLAPGIADGIANVLVPPP
jgi:hypothetical protein